MAGILGKSVRQELLDRPDYNRAVKNPDLFLNLSAQLNAGFQNSTFKKTADLLDFRSLEDTGPKLSVFELEQKYPTFRWNEPATDAQAKKILEHSELNQAIQSTIDENQKGVTSTILGMGANLLSATVASPETYVAPIVGRLATSTAMRTVLQSSRFGSAGTAVDLGKMVAAPAASSAKWVKKAEAISDKKFLMGFTEDLIITGLISEPIFQSAEELYQNPRGAEEYWTNVLGTAVFSGIANSTLGRFVDSATMEQHIRDRSAQLVYTLTGKNPAVVDPVFRKIAKAESQMAEGLSEANLPEGFGGRVRVFYDKNSSFVSGLDETTGDLVINMARANSRKKVKSALENPQRISSLKNKKFNYKEASGKVDQIKLPTTKLDENGISFLGNRARKKPDLEEPETAAGFEYDPAKAPQVYLDLYDRMAEDLGGYSNLSPEEAARVRLSEELDDGIELEDNLIDLEVDSKTGLTPLQKIAQTSEKPEVRAAVAVIEEQRSFAKKDFEAIKNLFESFGSSKKAVFDFFKSNDLSKEEAIIRQILQDNRITPNKITGASVDETLEVLKKELNSQAIIKAQRNLHQKRIVDEWGGYSSRAEVQGRLDGSLISGGSYFDGQGNNVYRTMERYRNEYAHLLRGALARTGTERFFDNYDVEARQFWSEVEQALSADKKGVQVRPEAVELARALSLILESQRNKLNSYGAGVRKLKGFLFSTVHSRKPIVDNKNAWNDFLLDSDNIDWEITLDKTNVTIKEKQDFIDAFYKDIDEGFLHDVDVDLEKHGGKKGQAFARSRAIHFKSGKQVEYNDKFGRANTAQEILDQIELRGKAIGITERLGADYKETWKAISKNLKDSDLVIAKQHFDEITGEANIVLNQDLASVTNSFINLTNAITLQGSGVTIALSDPVTQFVGLYASGLAPSMGRALRYMTDSYIPAIRALRGSDDEVAEALKRTILPYDSNIQATRKLLGDTSIERQNNIPERLSLNVIKYSGAGILTKLSQMTSLMSTQRALADMLKSKKFNDDFINTLKRFNISEKEFTSLAKKNVVRGDQLSVFHIENPKLRQKFQNLLDEQMRLGSLQADPRQAASARLGTRRGTFLGDAVRVVGLYMPTALAVHQKLLMRLAIMGNGDARFMELVKRSRRVEMAVIMGMMLGSATAIVSLKDILKNREPFWAGDKPLSPQHMARVLKVSGVVPLFTEFNDIVSGGMAGQMFRDTLELSETVATGSFPDILAKSKQFSPLPWTNFGPAVSGFDTLVGFVSEEYQRDVMKRQLNFEKISGQGKLID